MKRVIFWSVLTLAVISLMAMAAFMFFPKPRIGCDFDLRSNEIRCVMDGVDPYDVWSGKVEHAPYYPMGRSDLDAARFTRRVNAYPPWAYTFGMPLLLMPERMAWFVYFLFHFVLLTGLGFLGYRYAKGELEDPDDARLAAVVPLLLIVFAVGSCFQSGNYPMVVLAATLALVWCLNRGHDVLAGFCWALAMIKPQMVLLYAVPLLLRRKFLTCAVAAVLCLVASVPPMLACHKGMVELIREGVRGSSHAFSGCGTLPGFLVPLFGQNLSIVLALVVGLLLCLLLTVRTPRSANWFVYLTPAVFIGTAWSYSQLYASLVNWMPLLLIVIALLRTPTSRVHWILFALSCLFLTRVYTFYHGMTMLCPEVLGYPFSWHGLLDSVNSLIGLIVFVWFWLI